MPFVSVETLHKYHTVWQYFKDSEATHKAFRGGYFNSGDLAVMHPNGVVQIMDRSKDIIISGGEVSVIVLIPQRWYLYLDRTLQASP